MMKAGGSLFLGTAGAQIGPGHAGILKEAGRYWLSYHFYDASEHGISKLGLLPLEWGSDGWPATASTHDPLAGSATQNK
jgi:hypothetical protein